MLPFEPNSGIYFIANTEMYSIALIVDNKMCVSQPLNLPNILSVAHSLVLLHQVFDIHQFPHRHACSHQSLYVYLHR